MTATAAERQKGPAERISVELLCDQRRQTVKAAAHVGGFSDQPDLTPAGGAIIRAAPSPPVVAVDAHSYAVAKLDLNLAATLRSGCRCWPRTSRVGLIRSPRFGDPHRYQSHRRARPNHTTGVTSPSIDQAGADRVSPRHSLHPRPRSLAALRHLSDWLVTGQVLPAIRPPPSAANAQRPQRQDPGA